MKTRHEHLMKSQHRYQLLSISLVPVVCPCAQIFPRINDRVGAERAAAERVDAE